MNTWENSHKIKELRKVAAHSEPCCKVRWPKSQTSFWGCKLVCSGLTSTFLITELFSLDNTSQHVQGGTMWKLLLNWCRTEYLRSGILFLENWLEMHGGWRAWYKASFPSSCCSLISFTGWGRDSPLGSRTLE